MLGAVLFLAYLFVTQRRAPKFSNSLKNLPNLSDEPKVSVIITARNEEQTIGRCINSLTAQIYPNLEILVVDDSSTDRTSQIVREFAGKSTHLSLHEAGPKPDGWSGKSWPCWRGFEGSTGEILLFVDADSWFEPESIEFAVRYMLSSGIDMFSLSPRVEMKGIWARSVLPIITGAINLLYPMVKVNDKKSDRAYVFGTFFLVSRKVYESIGGHKKVREELVEDAAIARVAKSSGYNLRIERGSEYFATEWESSRSSIYHGLERITSISIRTYGLVSILNAILLFFVVIFPIAFVIGYLASILVRVSINPVLTVGFVSDLLSICSFLILVTLELKTIGGKIGLAPLLYPLGISFFILAIVTTSIKVSKGKRFKWKDAGFRQPSQKPLS